MPQQKFAIKYLTDVVDASTLDWELYLAPMAFSYNTNLHETIKTTPFYLTYGINPRTTDSLATEIQKQYGENDAAERINRLLFARQLANKQSATQGQLYEKYFNLKAKPHNFKQGDLVYLQVMNFLGKNKKLSPRFTGPFRLLKVTQEGVADISINGRTHKVNISRLKKFSPNNQSSSSDEKASVGNNENENQIRTQQPMDRHFNSIIPQQQHFQQQQQQVQQPLPPTQLVMSPSAEAPKRGRGRPRKNFASNLPQNVNLNQNLNLNIPRPQEVVENPSMIVQTDNQQNEIGDRRITRAMARAAERAALADPVAQNVVAAINREASRILQRLLIAKHGKKWIDWQTKNIPLDDFALPRQSDKTNTDWVRRRRAYLKRLTPSQRNSVLTGDPLFA